MSSRAKRSKYGYLTFYILGREGLWGRATDEILAPPPEGSRAVGWCSAAYALSVARRVALAEMNSSTLPDLMKGKMRSHWLR